MPFAVLRSAHRSFSVHKVTPVSWNRSRQVVPKCASRSAFEILQERAKDSAALTEEDVRRIIGGELRTWHDARQATDFLRRWRTARRPDVAITILGLMRKEKLEVNVYHYGAVVSTCGDRWQLALQLVNDMSNNQVQKNTVLYNATMNACVKAQHWAFSLWLFAEMISTKALSSKYSTQSSRP